MMRQIKTDVLVVGAGPAGAMLACLLARSNIKVLLVDRSSFPRDKVCGDILTPRSLESLHRQNLLHAVEERFNPFSQIQLFSDLRADNRLVSTVPSFGYIAPRLLLDQLLLDHAMDAGVQFLPEVTIVKPQIEDHQIVGAVGRQKDAELEITAKITVSAVGSAGSFSTKLGLTKDRTPDAIAARAYFHGVKSNVDTIELYYWEKFLPFYGWIIPINDLVTNVGLLMLTKHHQQINIKQAFSNFISTISKATDKLDQATQINNLGAFPLRMSFDPMHCYTAGALAVGDAAGLVDPLIGSGIGFALESAEIAAGYIIECIQRKDLSRRALRGYGLTLLGKYQLIFNYSRLFRYCMHIPTLAGGMIKLLPYT